MMPSLLLIWVLLGVLPGNHLVPASSASPCGRFHVFDVPSTYAEASTSCKNKGMELALPANFAENAALGEQIDMAGGTIFGVWVGINRLGRPGTTNSYSEFGRRLDNETIMWEVNEPNNVLGEELCVEFRSCCGYNDLACSRQLAYVCWG